MLGRALAGRKSIAGNTSIRGNGTMGGRAGSKDFFLKNDAFVLPRETNSKDEEREREKSTLLNIF